MKFRFEMKINCVDKILKCVILIFCCNIRLSFIAAAVEEMSDGEVSLKEKFVFVACHKT